MLLKPIHSSTNMASATLWSPSLSSLTSLTLTSGSAAPLSALSAVAGLLHWAVWPVPSGVPGASPQLSTHSRWDEEKELTLLFTPLWNVLQLVPKSFPGSSSHPVPNHPAFYTRVLSVSRAVRELRPSKISGSSFSSSSSSSSSFYNRKTEYIHGYTFIHTPLKDHSHRLPFFKSNFYSQTYIGPSESAGDGL